MKVFARSFFVLSVVSIASFLGFGCGSGSKCLNCTGLRAECVGSGACVYSGQAPGLPGSSVCYSNGVKLVYTMLEGENALSRQTVTKDGAACHTVEIRGTAASSTSTFKNPSGAVVGTLTFDLRAQTMTMACDGQSATYSFTAPPACPGVSTGNPSGCTMGACN